MLVGIFRGKPTGAENQVMAPPAVLPPRYASRPLLTPAERSFLGVLDLALGPAYQTFVKVRLADVLKVADARYNWQSQFNRISAKHIDFVVCDSTTLRVVAAVELDDASHQSAAAKDSDRFKNEALAVSGIRLVRFSAKRSYTVEDILRHFNGVPPPLPRR